MSTISETVALHRSDWQRIADHCGNQAHKHGAPKSIVSLCAAIQLAVTLLFEEMPENDFPWLTRPVEKWRAVVQMLSVNWVKQEHAGVYWAAMRIAEQVGMDVPNRTEQELEESFRLAGMAFCRQEPVTLSIADFRRKTELRAVDFSADAAHDPGLEDD